ncbi:MAG TPA: IS110 family transposase, partial [Firmicutes bacterium]|nr:IS110 family transposase [Bacillota bacterium]
MLKTLYVGIDISHKTNLAQFMNQEGELVRKPFNFPNNRDGLETFVAQLIPIISSQDYSQVKIGMEATGYYWWHLREYLDEHPLLRNINTQLFLINPSLIKAFKDAYTTLPKTDYVDAWVIADRLRFGRLKPLTEKDLRYQPLQRLTRLRYTLVRSTIAEKNRALGLLFLKFSEYTNVAGNRVFAKGPMTLLSEFTLDEILDKPVEELAQFIIEAGNARFSNPELFVEELKKAVHRSYRLNSKMQNSVDVALSMTMENIQFFKGQIKKLDRVIDKEVEAIPNTLGSVPGIGPVLAAGIISEVGDITRFHGHAALAKSAGLTWTRYQSGEFEAEETSLTKAGNLYLRYYLVEAASSLRLHNPEYAAFYKRKYDEVPKHQHKRALVLTARKFVRLVFALLSK